MTRCLSSGSDNGGSSRSGLGLLDNGLLLLLLLNLGLLDDGGGSLLGLGLLGRGGGSLLLLLLLDLSGGLLGLGGSGLAATDGGAELAQREASLLGLLGLLVRRGSLVLLAEEGQGRLALLSLQGLGNGSGLLSDGGGNLLSSSLLNSRGGSLLSGSSLLSDSLLLRGLLLGSLSLGGLLQEAKDAVMNY